MSFPRMSWHIGDYKKDTGHLNATGHGAYFLLCMHYWATGGLPDDDKQLARIACLSDREWKEWRPILRAFFLDGWRHKRIDEEIRLANEKYEKRARAGSEGGKATAKSKQNYSNATANDPAKTHQPITDNPIKIDDDDERAREPLISDDAKALADEITLIVGHDPEFVPPPWCGAAMHVSKWLRSGWKREIILVAVRRTMGRVRGEKPVSIVFFEKEIAREIARQAAPLPTATVLQGQTVSVGATNGKRTVHDAAREQLERLRADDDAESAGLRDGTGAGVVRLLPAR